MHSKTSFFKNVLIQKAVLRFWPAWTLYLVVLFFSVVMPVYNNRPQTEGIAAFSNAIGYLEPGYHPVMIFCFAILFALLVFSWLYSARSCNMMHAFPFKRSQLFASHYLTGFLFLAVPQFLIFLAVMPGCMQAGVVPSIVLRCFLFALACDFIFFSIAALCCMLAGHLLSALVYYLIFNSVCVIVRILFKGIYANYGYGMQNIDVAVTGKGDFLAPIVFITSRCGIGYDRNSEIAAALAGSVHIDGLLALLCYCAMAVLVLIAAMYLYKKRQVECAGEMSAFRPVNPVIRWIVTFCCGIATAVFLTEVLFDQGFTPGTFPQMVILTIVFSLVWYLVSEMVLKKSFRIFGPAMWTEWGILCAIIICLLGSVKADVFHVARSVPDVGSVRAMLIEGNYSIPVTDPAEIEQGIRLHESFLENESSYREAQKEYYENYGLDEKDGSLYMQPVSITYFLDYGKTLERNYYMPITKEDLADPQSAVNELTKLETPESAMLMMLGKDYESIRFTNAMIDDQALGADAAQELFTAVQKDLEEGNIHYQTRNQFDRKFKDDYWLEDSICLSLTGEAPGKYNNGISGAFAGISEQEAPNQSFDEDVFEGKRYYFYGSSNISHGEDMYRSVLDNTEITIDFWINETCEHTCSVLEKYGVISDPSDLKQMVNDYLQMMYDDTGGYGRG